MGKFQDLTGKIFGKLKVIKRVGSKKTGKNASTATWECLCECGNTKIVDTHSLNYNQTSSCGCKFQHKDRTIPAFHSLLNKYKQRAKARKLEFNITEVRFKELTSNTCFYCGESPSKICKEKCNSNYTYNGIDRLDSNKGYIEGNIVTCCWKCNAAKNDMSIEEFKTWIKEVYNYLIGAPW